MRGDVDRVERITRDDARKDRSVKHLGKLIDQQRQRRRERRANRASISERVHVVGDAELMRSIGVFPEFLE